MAVLWEQRAVLAVTHAHACSTVTHAHADTDSHTFANWNRGWGDRDTCADRYGNADRYRNGDADRYRNGDADRYRNADTFAFRPDLGRWGLRRYGGDA